MNRNKVYTVSLATIGILLVLAQVLSQYLLQKRNDDASLINRSGKQRMLSEKITKEILLYMNGNQAYADSAQRTINNWEYHHDFILNEDKADLLSSKALGDALEEVDSHFIESKRLMEELIHQPDSVAIKQSAELLSATSQYMNTMDKAVTLIQYDSRLQIGVIKRFELGMAILIALFLLMELLLIVRPLLFSYRDQNERLSELNNELQSKQEDLNENIARLEEAYQEKAEMASQLFINNLVIENSTNFIGLTDSDYRITFINDAGRQLTDIPPMDVIKRKRITEVLDPETARRYAREIIPVLRRGDSWEGRLFLKNYKTEELIPVQAAFFPVVGPHGETLAYACIQQDISAILAKENELQMIAEELQASQEELRVQLEEQAKLNELIEENESILRLAQEISNTGSFVIHKELDNYILKASDSASRIFELQKDGRYDLYEMLSYVRAEDRQRVQRYIALAIAGRNNDFDFVGKFPSGAVRHFHCSLVSEPHEGGEARIIGALVNVTPYKEVEEQLKISEARFDYALSGSEDGIWDWDLVKDEFYISERWSTMLGYEVGELGESVDLLWQIIHPDDAAHVDLGIKNHVKGISNQYSEEFRLRQKDGNYKWILSRGKVIRNEADKAIRFIGTHADIDNIKAAQAELDEKRSNLRAIIDNTSDLIWSVDTKMNLITFNEQYEKEFARAFNIKTKSGEYAFSAFNEEQKSNWEKAVKKAIEGKRQRFEYTFTWPEGVAFYDVSINPIRSDEGIHGAALYAKNITQRRNLEQNAKRQEEALSQLYEAVIQIDDPHERFQKTLDIGKTFYGLDFGLINLIETEEFEIANIFPEEGNYQKGYRSDLGTSYSNILIEQKGIVAFSDIEKTPFKEGEAYAKYQQKAFIGILLYVNENLYGSLSFFGNKARQNEFSNGEISFLRSMGEWIERDIEAIKYQEDLIAAKDRAELAARAKADFLATMSHEIRTPLNGVLGMTSLLEFTELNEEQRDFVSTIKMSGDGLLAIINDILDFSKIESGNMELEEHPLSIEQTIGETFDLLAAKATDKGLELLYQVDESISDSIVGDITRLRQILINLTSNAVKFTDEGEIVIRVTPGQQTGNIRFSVHDTGIGIPEEARQKLFKAFSQVDSSTTRKYGGTGLGLAISTRLVNAMKGIIGVESEVGKGSNFYFEIPLKLANKAELSLDFSKLKGQEICVVDDNTTNLKIMEHQFKRWGAVPTIFLRPSAMLEAIRQGYRPALFVLDYAMPDMDGLETARRIYEIVDTIPTLMLSSLNMHPEVKGSPYLSDALTKPVKHTVLLQVVNRLLGSEPFKKEPSKKLIEPEMPTAKNLRILLAEDNLFNQKLAIIVLGRLGYTVDMVTSGREAVEAYAAKSYDLILMDIQMLDMDGTEATRIIRDKYGEDGPVIIAMTANAMEGDKENYLANGMDDYIAKPIDIQHLKLTLQKYEKELQDQKS